MPERRTKKCKKKYFFLLNVLATVISLCHLLFFYYVNALK